MSRPERAPYEGKYNSTPAPFLTPTIPASRPTLARPPISEEIEEEKKNPLPTFTPLIPTPALTPLALRDPMEGKYSGDSKSEDEKKNFMADDDNGDEKSSGSNGSNLPVGLSIALSSSDFELLQCVNDQNLGSFALYALGLLPYIEIEGKIVQPCYFCDAMTCSHKGPYQFAEPRVVDEHEIDVNQWNLIGHGGAGHVFSVPFENHLRAVKIGQEADIFGECELLKHLHHPNIVQLIGHGKFLKRPSHPLLGKKKSEELFHVQYFTEYKGIETKAETKVLGFMVMELGKSSLYDLIKDQGTDILWEVRLYIAIGIIKGLQFLHSQKPRIIHRDLKSGNVMLRNDWEPFLIDFGWSKKKPDSNTPGTAMVGTLAWMAPEVLIDDGKIPINKAADIYSFGMILYEMLNGTMPFHEHPATLVRELVLTGARPDLPTDARLEGCPIGYIELMQQCWSQRAADRPQTEAILAKLVEMIKVTKCISNIIHVCKSDIGLLTKCNPECPEIVDTRIIEQYQVEADHDAEAQCTLGEHYFDGRGVAPNAEKAAELYRLAAGQGHARAQANLGYCYVEGYGVTKDINEAERLYLMGAKQGNAEALYRLGVYYNEGDRYDLKLIQKAWPFYEAAAGKDYALALLKVGHCYQIGYGVEKDFKKAAKCYRRAAKQEFPLAQLLLGMCYHTGQGVKQNITKAVALYRSAANKGLPYAQFILHQCVAFGLGCPKNDTEARKLFNASRQGNFRVFKTVFRQAASIRKDSISQLSQAPDDHTEVKQEKKKKLVYDVAYFDEDKAEEHKIKGNEFYGDGKLKEALEEYNESILRNPWNHKVFSNRAACYYRLGEWLKALEDCESCIRLEPKFVKIYSRKANVEITLKRYRAALETYEKGLKFDSDDEDLIRGKHKTLKLINNQSAGPVKSLVPLLQNLFPHHLIRIIAQYWQEIAYVGFDNLSPYDPSPQDIKAFINQILYNEGPKNEGWFCFFGNAVVSPIWYDNRLDGWYWSPDKTHFMSVSRMEVSGGLYQGEKPAECNQAIIQTLNKWDKDCRPLF